VGPCSGQSCPGRGLTTGLHQSHKSDLIPNSGFYTLILRDFSYEIRRYSSSCLKIVCRVLNVANCVSFIHLCTAPSVSPVFNQNSNYSPCEITFQAFSPLFTLPPPPAHTLTNSCGLGPLISRTQPTRGPVHAGIHRTYIRPRIYWHESLWQCPQAGTKRSVHVTPITRFCGLSHTSKANIAPYTYTIGDQLLKFPSDVSRPISYDKYKGCYISRRWKCRKVF
jgi:hypothetical protein